MSFRTKLDYSDNRQIRQSEKSSTVLSGGTVFGVPFSALTSGPDLSTKYQISQYIGFVSDFSGNNTTTIFNWTTPVDVSIVDSSISPIIPSNSGLTQSVDLLFQPSSSTNIDGNIVNLSYSGVELDNLYVTSMVEVSPDSYTGQVSSDFYIFTAGTLDFTGRTIWVDNTEILRTDRLIVSRNAQPGYVLAAINSEGMCDWVPSSTGGTGSTLYEVGSGVNSTQRIGVGNQANAEFSASLGGSNNVVSGPYGFIGGGSDNVVLSEHTSIVGGSGNTDSKNSEFGFIGGGALNYIGNHFDSILGGFDNSTNGYTSSITGGFNNSVNAPSSAIIVGSTNSILNSLGRCEHSAIIAGGGNILDSNPNSVLLGGANNMLMSPSSTILGGFGNVIDSNGGNNSIVGGNNCLLSGTTNSVIIGCLGLSATTDNTVYVPDLVIDGLVSQDPIATDANGKIVAGTSDFRLKKNIQKIFNGLDVVKNLRGVSYEYTDESNMGPGLRYGFIAQEVQEVIPEIVKFRAKGDGMLSLSYTEIIPWLVEAVKELASPNYKQNEIIIESESIKAEDNNIELNYNGTKESSIGGGITIVKGWSNDEDIHFKLNENRHWITNTYMSPYGLIIPKFTPSGSNDTVGVLNEITHDDNYFYIKTSDGWKRVYLESF